jgi:hypothetical protein
VIGKLSVAVDLFSLTVPSMEAFLINEVDITTTMAPIRMDQLVAESIRIRTINGPIGGAFKISKALSLVTTNGAITADVRIHTLTFAYLGFLSTDSCAFV